MPLDALPVYKLAIRTRPNHFQGDWGALFKESDGTHNKFSSWKPTELPNPFGWFVQIHWISLAFHPALGALWSSQWRVNCRCCRFWSKRFWGDSTEAIWLRRSDWSGSTEAIWLKRFDWSDSSETIWLKQPDSGPGEIWFEAIRQKRDFAGKEWNCESAKFTATLVARRSAVATQKAARENARECVDQRAWKEDELMSISWTWTCAVLVSIC